MDVRVGTLPSTLLKEQDGAPCVLDANLYASLLRRCRSLPDAKRLHSEMAEKKIRRDEETYLGNLVIQMYGNCGSLDDARRAFERVACKNVYTWSIFLQAHVHNGKNKEALQLLHWMDLEGMRPDTVTFISLLSACSSSRAFEQGEMLARRICETGLVEDASVCNSLLNMFGKCGAVGQARHYFERMLHRDVISWSTIIAAYAHKGQGGEAVELFHRMETEGVAPNEVTFVNVLHSCANSDAVDEGRKIHQLARKLGLETGLVVGTAIVGMYGKCRCMEEARDVFDNMTERDIMTWKTMISAYAQVGHSKEALQLFGYMSLEGVKANDMVFLGLLAACSDVESLGQLKKTHQLMRTCGFRTEIWTENTLIRMYGKCGDSDSAKSVFLSMARKDVVSWSAMLAVIAESGSFQEALNHFQNMDLEGVKPDYVTFVSLLDAFALLGNPVLAESVHERIRATGFDSVLYLGNSLINMYGKCGSLQAARDIFNRMADRSVVTWTSMITAYVQHNMGEEALKVYKEMEKTGTEPNVVTLVAAAEACSITKDLETGRRIHERVSFTGVRSNRVATALIDMYAKCESVNEAEMVFEKLVQGSSVPAWNAMLGAYSEKEHGDDSRVLYCYRCMNQAGVKPDDITFITVLSAWPSFRKLEDVKQVHLHVVLGGYEPELQIATAIVHIYGKFQNLADARLLFDRTDDKDVVLWNAMLGAYTSQGQGKAALELYTEMELEPTETTYMSLLEACACTGSVAQGREIHSEITDRGFDSDIQVATSLVYMYGKLSKIEEARSVFDSMREKTVVTWTAMVAGYAQHGDRLAARELYQEMSLEGIQPDQVTFLSIINSCSHSGMVEEGRFYFIKMVEDESFVASMELYVAVIDLLGRSGKLKEAEAVLKFMPVEPSLVAWNTLIAACKTHDDRDRAARLADCMLGLEPESAGPYVSLCNVI